MIAKVKNYSTTLVTPDPGGCNLETEYAPLLQRVCLCGRDLDDVIQQVRLAMKCGLVPLITVFEPKRSVNKYGN
jgi:hypothetical protein